MLRVRRSVRLRPRPSARSTSSAAPRTSSSGVRCCAHFVEACGGARRADRRRSRPRPSLGPEIVDVYAAVFTRLGAGAGRRRPPRDPRGRQRPATLVACSTTSTGIFMTGGNQLKLSAIINGTRVRRRDQGTPTRAASTIGGTSAGASFQSSHMVAFGTGGATPKQRMTQLAAGLGLRRGLRHRPALRPAQPLRPAADARRPVPNLLGIGVDEDTAAVITDDRCARGRRARRGHDHRRPAHDVERPRGQAHRAAAGLRRPAARVASRAQSSI